MEKEPSQNPEKKNENFSLRCIMASLIATVLFVGDLYVMINLPQNVIILVVITVLLLASVYLILDSAFKNKKQKEILEEEKFESLSKSEKASYLLLRKNFEELSSMIQDTAQNQKDPSDGIIQAQKAIAKVIINREKENADALMNSNDNVFEKVEAFEVKFNDFQNYVLENQKAITKEANDEISLKQEKLFIELNNMEASLKNELSELSQKVSGFQEEIEKMADSIAVMKTQAGSVPATESPIMPESIAASQEAISSEMSESLDAIGTEPEMPEGFDSIGIEPEMPEGLDAIRTEPEMPEGLDSIRIEPEISEELDSIGTEPEISEDFDSIGMESVISDEVGEGTEDTSADDELKLEDMLSIDDIINSIGESPEPMAEGEEIDSFGIDMDALSTDESTLDNESTLDTDISLEDESEVSDIDGMITEDTSLDDILKLADEPVEEEVSAPAADPNKIMTPDEIAALVANASSSEPVVKEEPIEEIKEEPTPAMPDLSDPNKIMTPDEIAALLANM